MTESKMLIFTKLAPPKVPKKRSRAGELTSPSVPLLVSPNHTATGLLTQCRFLGAACRLHLLVCRSYLALCRMERTSPPNTACMGTAKKRFVLEDLICQEPPRHLGVTPTASNRTLDSPRTGPPHHGS
jgi:hypothetical protein